MAGRLEGSRPAFVAHQQCSFHQTGDDGCHGIGQKDSPLICPCSCAATADAIPPAKEGLQFLLSEHIPAVPYNPGQAIVLIP